MAVELRKPIRSDVYKHVELAEKFLAEGRELIYRDPVQASEKLYKAAEEAVKALAKVFNLPQVDEAEKIGVWTAELLFKAVNTLAKKFGEDIRSWWHTAWGDAVAFSFGLAVYSSSTQLLNNFNS